MQLIAAPLGDRRLLPPFVPAHPVHEEHAGRSGRRLSGVHHHRAAERQLCPAAAARSITVYNLNPTKRGIVNNVLTWSDNNSRVYNGVEFSVERAPAARRLPVRRRDHRAHGRPTTAPTWRTRTRTTCASAIRRRRSRRCTRRRPATPSRGMFSSSGTFQARPGISIGSTYTFNSAQAGFAITGGGTLSVTVVDPTAQYYDYVKTLDARDGEGVPLRANAGCRCSWSCSTCRTRRRS